MCELPTDTEMIFSSFGDGDASGHWVGGTGDFLLFTMMAKALCSPCSTAMLPSQQQEESCGCGVTIVSAARGGGRFLRDGLRTAEREQAPAPATSQHT